MFDMMNVNPVERWEYELACRLDEMEQPRRRETREKRAVSSLTAVYSEGEYIPSADELKRIARRNNRK